MSYQKINVDFFRSINYRKLIRNTFRFLLVGLIVSSCVTSITWFGEMTSSPYPKRYKPQKYNYYHNYGGYSNDPSDRNTNSRSSIDYEYNEENTVQSRGEYNY